MYGQHPVVCVTPAGRRRYLRLLAPYVLASGLVDRWDLWLNTTVPADLAFCRGLSRLDPRVRLVPHPTGAPPGPEALGAFSHTAMEPGTVYVRFDDDVVWVEPGFFEGLISFRTAHPEYFLVAPLIVNNALSSNVLQTFGKIVSSRFVTTTCLDKAAWRDPDFAVALHHLVLDLIRRGETRRLHCGPVPVALNRFSINCISWFGEDMARAGGVVGIDEEEEISAVMGARLRRASCLQTDVVVAHFSFFSQREGVEASDVLEGYERALLARDDLSALRARVDAALGEANADDDGSDWAWPPRPPWTLREALRRLRRRRRAPRVTLRAGPAL
jgi:hypothetical protein